MSGLSRSPEHARARPVPEQGASTPLAAVEAHDLWTTLSRLPAGASEREAVRSELIERHLPLVDRLARRFTPSLTLEDAVQVGSIGLIKAVDGFDPELGHEFVSYAAPKIIGEIRRYLRDAAWLVRAPRRAQELQGAVAQARDDLTQELGRPPTLSEIAGRVGTDPHAVVEVLETFRSREAQHLDHTDAPPAGGAAPVAALAMEERGYLATEVRMDLAQAMSSLDEREREVVRLRFVDKLSQAEIADRIGVSQMQVSRILRRSVDRLRRRMQA